MKTTYLPRILILAGFAIGLKSLAMTPGHVADPACTTSKRKKKINRA